MDGLVKKIAEKFGAYMKIDIHLQCTIKVVHYNRSIIIIR